MNALITNLNDIIYTDLSGDIFIINGRVSGFYDISSSIQGLLNNKLNLTGGAISGNLTVYGDIYTTTINYAQSGNLVVAIFQNGVLSESSTTTTQLSYLDATSSIQTQINNKLSLTGGYMTGDLHIFGPTVSNIAGHRLFSVGGNAYYDTYGSNTFFRTGNLGASQQPLKWDTSGNISLSNNTINISNTGNITNGSINGHSISYIDMTSSIQTQINNKFDKSGGTITGNLIVSYSGNSCVAISNSYANSYFGMANSVGAFSGSALSGDLIIRNDNRLIFQNGTGNSAILIDLSNNVNMNNDLKIIKNLDVSGNLTANIIYSYYLSATNNISATNDILCGNNVHCNKLVIDNLYNSSGAGGITNEFSVNAQILNIENNFWTNNGISDINTGLWGTMFRQDNRSGVNQPYQFFLRTNATTYTLLAYLNSSSSGLITTSDEKLKNNIQPIKMDKSLERIKNITISSFFYNHASEEDIKDNKKSIGVVAQNVQIVNPHAVYEHTNLDDTKNLSVSYNDLFLHGLNSIKELDRRLSLIENNLSSISDTPALTNVELIEESKTYNTPIPQDDRNLNDLIERINILENQIISQQNQINEHQKIILLLKKNINKLK